MLFHSRKNGDGRLLDSAIAIALICAIFALYRQMATNFFYQWNWGAIPQFLFRFDPECGSWVPNLLVQGFLTTIRLSIWSCLLAIVIGGLMGLCRTSPRLFFRLIGQSYVGLVRNLPPLVLIFIFYFFVSSQIMPLTGLPEMVHALSPQAARLLAILFAPPNLFSEFFSALITLALFEGAYITEIVRAALESVEQGQWDGAAALGLSRSQAVRHVIFPQALPRMLPPLGGQFISTIKDSAIVSVISIQDLTFQGMEIMASTYMALEIWITITLMYFLLTFTCSLAVRRLELRLRTR